MTDIILNQALGKIRTFADNAAGDVTNAAFILVPLSAVEADDAVRDHDDLSTLLGAAGNTELTTGGWNRKTIADADVTVTVDDTSNRVDIDVPDQTWTGVTAGNDSVAVAFNYDDDTIAGTDANVTPVSKHDFAVTADGSDVTLQVATAGLLRAA